ncbi:hypothetical protein ACMX2H_11505 [Arthrobacter sulfonylureivorans]|uniref:hypothetical protein n=1 Tax=Arthrobacter sulfonylureivorans TaxID=2486855 RepID=UPI0039E60BFC
MAAKDVLRDAVAEAIFTAGAKAAGTGETYEMVQPAQRQWHRMYADAGLEVLLDPPRAVGEDMAKRLWVADCGIEDLAWAEMAWADMGGGEPSDERAQYEIRVDELLAVLRKAIG